MGSQFQGVMTTLGSFAGIGALAWAIFIYKSAEKTTPPPNQPPAPTPQVIVQIVEPAPAKPTPVESQVASAYSGGPIASATPAPHVQAYEPPPEVKPQTDATIKDHVVAVVPPPKSVPSAVSAALLSVTRFGDHDNVKRLLRNGADPNAAFEDGKTPLIVAAENGHRDICKTLLEAGANMTATDQRGRNALHYAAEGGHNDVVQYLLQYGVPGAVVDNEMNTPLTLAERHGHNTCAAVIRKTLEVLQIPR